MIIVVAMMMLTPFMLAPFVFTPFMLAPVAFAISIIWHCTIFDDGCRLVNPLRLYVDGRWRAIHHRWRIIGGCTNRD
jgi:hypothetical protein